MDIASLINWGANAMAGSLPSNPPDERRMSPLNEGGWGQPYYCPEDDGFYYHSSTGFRRLPIPPGSGLYADRKKELPQIALPVTP